MVPRVALPHQPANGVPVTEVVGTPIDWVFLGTCTGGRAHDFRDALRVLDAGGGIAPGVTVVVTPPSPRVRAALEEDGTLNSVGSPRRPHHRDGVRTVLRDVRPHPPSQRPDHVHGQP